MLPPAGCFQIVSANRMCVGSQRAGKLGEQGIFSGAHLLATKTEKTTFLGKPVHKGVADIA